MNRPPLEVADLIRVAGQRFIERSRHWLTGQHRKVLAPSNAAVRPRSAGIWMSVPAVGIAPSLTTRAATGTAPSVRPTPATVGLRRRPGTAAHPYVHVVFTLPRRIAPLALQNKKVVYDLLFRLSAETLIEVARNPERLGAEIGFFSVLHTWNQRLDHHPHVHCVVPAGGLSPDHTNWIRSPDRFFLPHKVLARVFRAKFVQALEQAFRQGQIEFHGELRPLSDLKAFRAFVRQLFRQDWVAHCKRPFGGPEHVLSYLGHYTHRVAISNRRLVSFANDKVTFRWRDRAHGDKQKAMTLVVDEFLRRFLLHLLPNGFVRIRHFGFLANRKRAALLPLCFRLLGSAPEQPDHGNDSTESLQALWLCPKCGGAMITILRITAIAGFQRSPPAQS